MRRATSTTAFTPSAATVLNIGQVPKKRTIPSVDTTADAMASGCHASPLPNQKMIDSHWLKEWMVD